MANPKGLSWRMDGTPCDVAGALEVLGQHYPIRQREAAGLVPVRFVKIANKAADKGIVEVTREGSGAVIRYSTLTGALRGVGTVLAGLAGAGGKACREKAPFETFGIMLDCSRNAVMTVEHFKEWLRKLALLGYNMAMLYCEDTYELPGESFFGYMRGRYTADELRAIDDYAAKLGIEMIGCIQTLGHLEQILKWRPPYGEVRDTNSVLMVGEDATYRLIEKMIAHYAGIFRSRRIHVGMDETHDLGRGRYMDLNGFRPGYDLFNEHLGKVVEICSRRGMSPMIWSDMYFRMGSKTQDYYDKELRIPPAVKAAIPRQAQLVYWDYYHDNEAFYLDWIARHRALGFEPLMGSGTWTWSQFWYNRYISETNGAPCVRACRKAGLKEFFFTLWGDDGGYCEFDSALAGLAWGAELAYRGDDVDDKSLRGRFAAVCGADYAATIAGSDMTNHGPDILWDDPIYGLYFRARRFADGKFWPKARADFSRAAAALARPAKQSGAGSHAVDYAYGATMAAYLAEKVDFRIALEKAYAARNKPALKALARKIDGVVKNTDKLLAAYRRQWLRRNKPNGLETVQIRLGALKQRYAELKQRLTELAAGKIASIPEMDEPVGGDARPWGWRGIVSPSSIV